MLNYGLRVTLTHLILKRNNHKLSFMAVIDSDCKLG